MQQHPDQLDPSEIEQANMVFPALAAVELGLGVLALAIAWFLNYQGPSQAWERLVTPEQFGRDLIWGMLATLPMFSAAWALERSRLRPLRHLRFIVHQLVAEVFYTCSTWQVALISLLAGVGEELLFRGVMFDAVRGEGGITGAMLVAFLVSCLLFGFAHAITRAYLWVATAIGAYFAILLMLSDSLLVPMIAHAFYDFVMLEFFLWRLVRTNGCSRL